MILLRKFTYALSLLCIFCTPVSGQEAGTLETFWPEDTVETVTLSTLVERGLQNNFQLRIVRNQERIAQNNATKAHAGYLPKVNLNGGYNGSLQSSRSTPRDGGKTDKQGNVLTHNVNAGIFAEWTVFDGFKIQTNYKRLQELRQYSVTQTRIALENYVADLAAEYYELIQQKIQLKNLQHTVELSRERLRIVEERYAIGNGSRLAVQQAQVDFNADSARCLKQTELLRSASIHLNLLIADENLGKQLNIAATHIDVDSSLVLKDLWNHTLQANARLLQAAQNRTLAELDFKAVKSRDYPYIKLNANYAYRFSHFHEGATANRSNWGTDFGLTLGYKIFDGNRKRERRNALISIENAELAHRDLKLSLKADLVNLWQAYRNNMLLLNLERENLETARENHYIARERYLLGDLSGIEMREAQQNLLKAEEQILIAEFQTKLCEISLLQLSGQILRFVPQP